MITLIKDLFVQLGLVEVVAFESEYIKYKSNDDKTVEKDLELCTAFSFKENDKKSYWLILETYKLEDIIANQAIYFEEAKKILNNDWFDKNANLLIIYKVKSFEGVQKKVMEIEENPYLFKKQVILYKESEYEHLNNALKTEGTNIANFIESKILDESIFKIHKESLNNNSYESLLYRLAFKIPVIKLIIVQEDNLEALNETNKEKVFASSLGDINDVIEHNIFNLGIDDIKQKDSDSIYELLLNTLSTDENKKDTN
ncbi:ABC-three component system middle component 1 [Myroides sp. LJL116]